MLDRSFIEEINLVNACCQMRWPLIGSKTSFKIGYILRSWKYIRLMHPSMLYACLVISCLVLSGNSWSRSESRQSSLEQAPYPQMAPTIRYFGRQSWRLQSDRTCMRLIRELLRPVSFHVIIIIIIIIIVAVVAVVVVIVVITAIIVCRRGHHRHCGVALIV